MKAHVQLILILQLPCLIAHAQNNVSIEKGYASLAATVHVKSLQPNLDYQPPIPIGPSSWVNPKPTLTKKNRPETRNTIPFPVTEVTTLQAGAININGTNSPEIYESPCIVDAGMNQLSSIPPDVAGAVGFDHLVMALNDQMHIRDKKGNVVYQQRQGAADGFWSALDTTNLFDPKIIYDPYRKRWLYVILADARSATSAALIAVSQTYDPTEGWYLYRINADAGGTNWFDYPSIGFNKNWFVISGNMFANSGGSTTRARTFIFNINELYSGSGLTYTTATTDNYSTLCPSLTYDPNLNDLWLATNDDVDDNDIRFFKISGTASSPSLTEESFISVGSAWGRGDVDIAPQSGTSTRINPGDHRIVSVVWRNSSLFISQTVHIPSSQNPPDYCTIQFVICNPATATVHQAIRFAASSTSMYAYPFLTVNENGDIIISCSKFTSSTFPSACVLVRRGGTTSFTETIFQAGQDFYINTDNQGRNRWGDYTTAMVDPSDDNSVWVASEYSRPRAAGNIGRWGTMWAKICSNICLPNITVNTIQGNGVMKKFETSGTLFANSQIQPGAIIKFDAGTRIVFQPGFKALSGSNLYTYLEGCGGRQ